MTQLKKTTAIALVALMSASPMAALATETGSPAQSVDADPDESTGATATTSGSVIQNVDTGSPAQSVDTDADEEVAQGEAGEGTIADELPTNSPAVLD